MKWESLKRDQLLGMRMADLDLDLENCFAYELAEKTVDDMHERGIRLTPHFWFADEWFSPENVPGVAIPFYLAHPKLMRLEREMMLEVEGGTRAECVKLLRHEFGHAVQHAYALHRRKSWRDMFGSAREKYPDFYRPRPGSKRFVVHLDGWYAQSHPVEDFAETFAVWLNPTSRWRRRYAGWPALKKLEYVDELMSEIAGQAPKVKSKARPYALRTLKHTLGEHYAKRQSHFSTNYSPQYDQDLLRIFSDDPTFAAEESAAKFLRRHQKTIRVRIAAYSGESQFALEQVLKEVVGRSKELGLRLCRSEAETLIDFAVMITAHTVQTLHRGNEWHPM